LDRRPRTGQATAASPPADDVAAAASVPSSAHLLTAVTLKLSITAASMRSLPHSSRDDTAAKASAPAMAQLSPWPQASAPPPRVLAEEGPPAAVDRANTQGGSDTLVAKGAAAAATAAASAAGDAAPAAAAAASLSAAPAGSTEMEGNAAADAARTLRGTGVPSSRRSTNRQPAGTAPRCSVWEGQPAAEGGSGVTGAPDAFPASTACSSGLERRVPAWRYTAESAGSRIRCKSAEGTLVEAVAAPGSAVLGPDAGD